MLREGILRSKLLLLQILNPALKLCNLGFVHFDRRCVWTVGAAVFPVACGFFPPVSHMMTTMSRAMPMITQDWNVLRKQARRLWCFVLDRFVHGFPPRMWLMQELLSASREGDLFLANREVSAVGHWVDVHAVFDLEIDQVRFAVFHFVKRGFSRAAHLM